MDCSGGAPGRVGAGTISGVTDAVGLLPLMLPLAELAAVGADSAGSFEEPGACGAADCAVAAVAATGGDPGSG